MDPPAWDDTSPNDEPGQQSYSEWSGKDGLVFLIDATKPMFLKNGYEEVPFLTCLRLANAPVVLSQTAEDGEIECCKTTMLNKIISSEHDLVGVVLFGTGKTDNHLNVPHISTLQDLAEPSPDKIKQLENMLNCKSNYCHWTTSKVKLTSQRVLVFTNTCDPHKDNPHKQNQARKKAEDLGKSGMDLELLHLGANFDTGLFYKDLLQLAKGDDDPDWDIPNPATKLEELLSRVCRKDYKKRSVGKLYLTLGKGVRISVGVYNLARVTPMPKTQNLNRDTNEIVKTSRIDFHAVSSSHFITKYCAQAWQSLRGRERERERCRDKEIVLHAQGCTAAVETSEIDGEVEEEGEAELISGDKASSRLLFAALLKRCSERQVAPICVFTPRQGSRPYHVALFAQTEQVDESNIQIVPPGFHVIYLPYRDFFRELQLDDEPVDPSDEQVGLAEEIVSKLKFSYNPHMFNNPVLQTHWSNIEALALDYDERRECVNVACISVPDLTVMDKKLGSLAQQFMEACDLDATDFSTKKPPSKREPVEGGLGPANKVLKLLDMDVPSLANEGKVEKLKLDELKTYLTSEGLKIAGKKKAELVDMVYTFLGVQQPH
ncbi:unnamed protein product [Timema podura]|uniref:ATP-dependent DNA helicase 2 subunit 1 n=1 Tax=Timema podura TaxID=61482 RepID=A0ABN7ND43_TIMPD|nr:unnamed protein product [Timema podura]